MSVAEKRATIREFNFKKGVFVATFSGIMSACFAFGLSAGKAIGDISRSHGTPEIWTGLPVLIVVLAGGFTTNFLWCMMLNVKNGTGFQYFSLKAGKYTPPSIPIADGAGMAASDGRRDPTPVPLTKNYFFSALAGVT